MKNRPGNLFYPFALVFIAGFLTACGGGGGEKKYSTYAIAPDPAHTGDDCGCGGKNSYGQTMALSASSGMPASASRAKYVPGEVLIKFREGTNTAAMARVTDKIGASEVKSLYARKAGYASRLKKIKLKADESVEDAIKKLSAFPEVEYAEPNYIYRINRIPDDSSYGHQWGMNNTGQEVNGFTGTRDKDIGAQEVWDTITDCGDVVVAVLDSGVNYRHRDLASNLWNGGNQYPKHGYDFVDDDNDPMDLNGHGTHCAGIIGARGDDGKGLAGVCWSVKLMAVRVLDAAGNGTLADVAQGIEFAVGNGAHVINLSLSGPNSDILSRAVNEAKRKGVILVAAAGNEATDVKDNHYPAAYSDDNIISVAAVNQKGELASFSNYGDWVDIAAPGVNILSTWPGQSVETQEEFNNWTMGKGWGTGKYEYIGPSGNILVELLTNPSPFDNQHAYMNNLDSTAYRIFAPGQYGAASAVVSFYAHYDIENDRDFLRFKYNPRPGMPNTFIEEYTGNSNGLLYIGSFDFTPLLKRTISLGATRSRIALSDGDSPSM